MVWSVLLVTWLVYNIEINVLIYGHTKGGVCVGEALGWYNNITPFTLNYAFRPIPLLKLYFYYRQQQTKPPKQSRLLIRALEMNCYHTS